MDAVINVRDPSTMSVDETSRAVVVRRLLEELGADFANSREVFGRYLTTDVLWENSGRPPCRGIDAAVELVESARATFDMQRSRTEFRHVAESSDCVLVERVDSFSRGDGSMIASLPIMGTFEFRSGKVSRWSDYYDSAYGGR